MCGRFTLTTPTELLATLFDTLAPSGEPAFAGPRYNIAPTQPVPIIRRAEGGGRELTAAKWGLIPHWAPDGDGGGKHVNARSETARHKPAFRSSAAQRRCLIPADGFYEWKAVGGKKRPYHIRRPDRGVFAFAGLWDRWVPPEGEPVETCSILTTDATAALSDLHPRMPVIVPASAFDEWLTPGPLPEDRWHTLLRGRESSDGLELVPVSSAVNHVRIDGPECLADFDPKSEAERAVNSREDQPGLFGTLG